jgi:hypothetical protein
MTSDPTRQEMLDYLLKHFRLHNDSEQPFVEFDLSAEEAIYWFASWYHGGQSSNLYSALSTSPYKPSPLARGIEEDTLAYEMLNSLIEATGNKPQ